MFPLEGYQPSRGVSLKEMSTLEIFNIERCPPQGGVNLQQDVDLKESCSALRGIHLNEVSIIED